MTPLSRRRFPSSFFRCALAIAAALAATGFGSSLRGQTPAGAAPLTAEAADLFAAYIHKAAPKVLREIASEAARPDGVLVREVVFEGRTRQTAEGPVANEIYALIARPAGDGPRPGLLVLHGGKGTADKEAAIRWARAGYVALAPDLPGIGDGAAMAHSRGWWKALGYAHGRMVSDLTASTYFDAETTALEAFHLLQAQPAVDRARLGITGISLGGYTTTLLAGLLGDQVKAAFSIYGAGFWEDTIFARDLKPLSPEQQARWYAGFDAGRRAAGIRAAYGIIAASNDTFFYPPSVERTLAAIPGEKTWVYAPNADHTTKTFPGGVPAEKGQPRPQDLAFFDLHLKGQGEPFPRVTLATPPGEPTAAAAIRFTVTSARPLTAVRVFYSAAGGEWKKRTWLESEAQRGEDGGFTARLAPLPEGLGAEGGHWFVLATDDRPVSVSSSVERFVP